VVVIFANNNAAAAKLRLWAPKIAELLGTFGFQVTKIKVEVQAVDGVAGEPIVRKARTLSPHGATALARLGSRLPEGRLKRAVIVLSQKAMRDKGRPG
jgi:hypothetical protein